MIAFQGPEDIEFWRPHEIASIMPEFRNWWRGVRSDGRVAHRPTPPPSGPYVPHAGGFVNSRFLVEQDGRWRDPADFLLPGGPIPDSPPEPESPVVAGLGLRADQVCALHKVEYKQDVIWSTDEGEILWPNIKLQDAAHLVPDLVLFKAGKYINRRRLASVRHVDRDRCFYCLDNGREFKTTPRTPVRERLGLTSTARLEPSMNGRFEVYQLRDWPIDLFKASKEFLRSHFKTPDQLIGHLIWQRFRDRQAGIFKRWGDTYRDFWYCVLSPVLYRAGFLEPSEILREVSLEPKRGKQSPSERLFRRTFHIMLYFVQTWRFFDFHEFGFKDLQPENFTVGKLRPEVVLVTEKDDCLEYAKKLVKEFGVSHYHLGGQPSVLRSEYVAERLLKVLKTIRVIAYVDYDAGGHVIGQAAADQLADRGVEVTRVDFLLREECFSEEEKRLHSHPCKMGSAAHRTKVRRWLERGGGLNGQARGIFASYVEPYARVRGLFLDCLNR